MLALRGVGPGKECDAGSSRAVGLALDDAPADAVDRAARSRSGRARPRGCGARTSAAMSVTPASPARASARGALPAICAALQTTRPKPSEGSERRAVRSRALATTRVRAAQHVDHDDLVGEPALGADAPPERHALAEARERGAVGRALAGDGAEADEHRRLGHAGRHEQHARRARAAGAAQGDDRDAAAVQRRQRRQAARPAASRGRAASARPPSSCS